MVEIRQLPAACREALDIGVLPAPSADQAGCELFTQYTRDRTSILVPIKHATLSTALYESLTYINKVPIRLQRDQLR